MPPKNALSQAEIEELNAQRKLKMLRVGLVLFVIGVLLAILKVFKYPADYFTIGVAVFGGLFFIVKGKGWDKRS